MSYLAEHLVVDILVRLPASSIIRFECICKSWYYLIRNPNFMLFHSAICKNNQQLLVHKYSSFDFCDTISLLSNKRECFESQSLSESLGINRLSEFSLRVAGSCNGVLCFVHSNFDHKFLLFNPSIKHCLWLPKPNLEKRWNDISVGFGFDISTKDFKILKFESSPAVAEIYSLNSNSWRDISVPKFSHVFHRFGVFVNGALHWVVRINKKSLIISFDVKDETFRSIALPSSYVDYRRLMDLNVVEFGGSSIAFAQQHDSVFCESDIWVMKEYGVTESWTHLATISANWRGQPKVLLMFGDQDRVFIRIGSKCLASQKLNRRRAVKTLVAVGKHESISPHRYVPSLFLLDKENNIQAQI